MERYASCPESNEQTKGFCKHFAAKKSCSYIISEFCMIVLSPENVRPCLAVVVCYVKTHYLVYSKKEVFSLFLSKHCMHLVRLSEAFISTSSTSRDFSIQLIQEIVLLPHIPANYVYWGLQICLQFKANGRLRIHRVKKGKWCCN